MDKVSPLFQERLKTIPPQLRKIVIEMAFLWEACNTKQLVAACKMDSKLISANLKTLSKYGIVDIIDTKKRNHLYRLSERFFNMWLIATQGNPNQKRKAKYLSIFLENWYDAKDFKQLVAQHLENLKSKSLSIDKALLLTKAYSQSRFVSTIERDTLINRTKSLPNYNHQYDDELPESCIEIYKKIDALIGKEKYDDAFQIAENIENESDGIKFSVLGFIYEIQQKFDLAEIYYLKAIDYGENNALIYLASLYTEKQKFDLAEKYFLKAIENGDNKALFGLALLYNKQQKFDLAEKYFLKAIEYGDNEALFGLALLYENLEKFDLAEKHYLKAIESGHNGALKNLALLYYTLNINKLKALELISQYYINSKNEKLLNEVIFKIWNGKFENIEREIQEILNTNIDNQDFALEIQELLIHQQKNLLYSIFQENKLLQEKYQVMYYVIQLLVNPTDENLKLLIPPELNETITAILNYIKEKSKFYGYS
jgi:tetratricopeptide (TPR) repeat protein